MGIGANVVSILADGLPAFSVEFVSEGDRRNLRRLALVVQTFVIVRSRHSAGKQNAVLMFACARHNAEPSRARMRRQLTPLNLVGILMIDLAHPTFIRGHVAAGGVLLCPVHIDDGLVRQPTSMAKD